MYGARNQAELYYFHLFSDLARQHDNFHYLAALSEPADTDDWDGPRCFVHELAEEHFGKRFEGHKAYLCGPPPMVDSCITSLMRGRLFEEHIFMENFFTAADSENPAAPQRPVQEVLKKNHRGHRGIKNDLFWKISTKSCLNFNEKPDRKRYLTVGF